MIEFYSYSWVVQIFITFILGICVLTQTLALVLSSYSRSLKKIRVFEDLLEMFILIEIIVFSFLHGQLVNGYKNGLVVPRGYENISIIVFVLILLLAIYVSVSRKTWVPFIVLPATVVILPIVENNIGWAFPWFFVAALFLFLGRSIKICSSSVIIIKTNISALSVKNAIDILHTGVLFSDKDGHILLYNHKMQNLMKTITGRIFRNSIQFYDRLVSDKYESRYRKAELEGQVVYLLPDNTAWMFTKADIRFQMNNYIHISAADVSEQWELTTKLQLKNTELMNKSDELKETIANLHLFSKEREIENAKMRAHDILGQRLSVLLRIIRNENNIDHDLLTSLSKGLIAELKAEQSETGPYDELKNIQQIFSAIGVDIKFDGQLPEDDEKAFLFIDIIREGSTNAVRHGLATEIVIKSESIKNSYNLTISNNGHSVISPITPGSGIKVMEKKVNNKGGKFSIITNPQFTLSVFLPGGGLYD